MKDLLHGMYGVGAATVKFCEDFIVREEIATDMKMFETGGKWYIVVLLGDIVGMAFV